MGIWVIEGMAFAGIVGLMVWTAWRQRRLSDLDEPEREDATDSRPPTG